MVSSLTGVLVNPGETLFKPFLEELVQILHEAGHALQTLTRNRGGRLGSGVVHGNASERSTVNGRKKEKYKNFLGEDFSPFTLVTRFPTSYSILEQVPYSLRTLIPAKLSCNLVSFLMTSIPPISL